MKAATIGPEFGNEHLRVTEKDMPSIATGDVLIQVDKGGLNPVDYNLINGKLIYNISPIPHVPGTEVIGTAVTDGKLINRGDRVIIYNRVFDGTCEKCITNREHLCINGGIWGVITDGGYQEYVSVPEKNLFKMEDYLDEDVAASLPVAGLTAYHALKRVSARSGESILVYGASGNTGMFIVQFAKIMGMHVYGVSRNLWIKSFGCDEVFSTKSVPQDLTADIVVNSLGSEFWDESSKHLSVSGRLVTFGIQTGKEASLDISKIYSRETTIVGSTGGTRKDLHEIISIARDYQLRIKKFKEYPISELKQALSDFQKRHEGRILINMKK
ncbi:MAG: alcohol dehydrogenase catalytic domain-containing protein [Thermoplasmatales archaeon]|nr:alcohol dehydrogenase catalytic domain-containing protein [Thermoplasmatales archaeon]MCW6170269.1 alcohol dehydrogenase catalytic domain-containing protein [Thermoplasmatales archaeon]